MTSIRVPASKSVSHRALIAAALSLGTSRVKAPLKSQDLDRTRECLERLGAVFQEEGEDLIVRGAGSSLDLTRKGTIALPVGESGTTCRLITAVAAAFSGTFHLSGKGRMHERPIRDLTDGLAPLGPRFDFLEREGFPPFLLKSSGLSGGETAVSLEESSQFLSGLLLAAPLAKAGLTLSIAGDKVVSWPYVGITLQTMQEFGVEPVLEVLEDGNWNQKGYHDIATVTPGQVRFRTKPTAYRAREYTVEGDWSNSSYFLAASALLPEPLAVTGLNRDSLQGDRAILDILARMGADVLWEDGVVSVRGGDLHGIEVDMGHCPDLVPTVSVVASLAAGTTRIRNVAHLRIKESDRLMAVSTELGRVGVRTELFSDGIDIHPSPIQAGTAAQIKTYGDHRIAMSMSILELAGVIVHPDDPGCVAKSFPAFWEKWEIVRRAYGRTR